tara:strand:+ start:93 stop:1439 length:1347 start_codon:yes stop_codon:yes gene_type:complete
MSSTMVNMPQKSSKKGLFGSQKPTPVWLQFVPGIVLDVVINNESPAYQSDRDINSILAKSHVTPTDSLRLKGASKKRYYPLFRGFTDTPIKGDQVLLCTFGGVDYYMGPINTSNSPNWNIDQMNLRNSGGLLSLVPGFDAAKGFSKYGLSRTFPQSEDIKRMQKPFKLDLDDSLSKYTTKSENSKLLETHGDMVFEGRHGNSIRVGSRDMNPYILFSNGRSLGNESESNNDGTVILISDDGTIHQHFPNDIQFEEEGEPTPKLFILASDTVGIDKENGQKRLIGALDTENADSTGLYNYEYDKPHFFLNSDKITFNSKNDSMFLSSYSDIVLGAGNTFNIISENETIIESSNIYLGRQAKNKKKDSESETPAEPLVLGEQLRIFLTEFIEVLEQAHGLCQGAPIPVMDQTGAPLLPKLQQLKEKINAVDTAPFNSQYHYIEDNGQKPE